jgi:hypothetical protein
VGVPIINSYQFGQIDIDGDTYRRDVIIFPDRVMPNWWREQGHSLTLEDLHAVLAEKPELLIIGLGRYALMKIPAETRLALSQHGVELLELPTHEACEQYNQLSGTRKVVAALHLTC